MEPSDLPSLASYGCKSLYLLYLKYHFKIKTLFFPFNMVEMRHQIEVLMT